MSTEIIHPVPAGFPKKQSKSFVIIEEGRTLLVDETHTEKAAQEKQSETDTQRGGRRKKRSTFLVKETKKMERMRRLFEQECERLLAQVHAREHSTEEIPYLEGELQNTILQHPYLNTQRFDGTDSSLNPEPALNTEARREYDNQKREQEKEKQLRLNLELGMTPSSAPTPNLG
jgi:hypothetical protein